MSIAQPQSKKVLASPVFMVSCNKAGQDFVSLRSGRAAARYKDRWTKSLTHDEGVSVCLFSLDQEAERLPTQNPLQSAQSRKDDVILLVRSRQLAAPRLDVPYACPTGVLIYSFPFCPVSFWKSQERKEIISRLHQKVEENNSPLAKSRAQP